MSAIPIILAALQLAQTLTPEIETLIPLIEKGLNGEPLTDADAVTAEGVRKALEAQAFPTAAP